MSFDRKQQILDMVESALKDGSSLVFAGGSILMFVSEAELRKLAAPRSGAMSVGH